MALTQEDLDFIERKYGAPAAAPPSGVFLPSVKRTYGGIASALGTTLGDLGVQTPLRGYGARIMRENPPAVTPEDYLETSPLTAFKQAAGEQTARLGTQAASAGVLGLVGRLLGSRFGPAGAEVGQRIGAYAGGLGSIGTEIYGGLREQGATIPRALAATVPESLIETIAGPQRWISGWIGGAAKPLAKEVLEHAAKGQFKPILKAAGKEMVKQQLGEASEEAAQNPFEKWALKQDVFTKEVWKDVPFQMYMAALGVAPFGAGAGMVDASRFNKAVQEQIDLNKQVEIEKAAQVAADQRATAAEKQAAVETLVTAKRDAEVQQMWAAQPDIVGQARLDLMANSKTRPETLPDSPLARSLLHPDTTLEQVRALTEVVAVGAQDAMPQSVAELRAALFEQAAVPKQEKVKAAKEAAKEQAQLVALQNERLSAEPKRLVQIEAQLQKIADSRREQFTELATSLAQVQAHMESYAGRAAEPAVEAPAVEAPAVAEPAARPDVESAFALREAQKQAELERIAVETRVAEGAKEAETAELLSGVAAAQPALPGAMEQAFARAQKVRVRNTAPDALWTEREMTAPEAEALVARGAPVEVTPVVQEVPSLFATLVAARAAEKGGTEKQNTAQVKQLLKGVDINDNAAVAQRVAERANSKAAPASVSLYLNAVQAYEAQNAVQEPVATQLDVGQRPQDGGEVGIQNAQGQVTEQTQAPARGKKAKQKGELNAAQTTEAALPGVPEEAQSATPVPQSLVQQITAAAEAAPKKKPLAAENLSEAEITKLLKKVARAKATPEAQKQQAEGQLISLRIDPNRVVALEAAKTWLTENWFKDDGINKDLESRSALANELTAWTPHFDYLGKIIGNPEGWKVDVTTSAELDGAVGRFSQTRQLISLAYNASDWLSAQAHEGYHYLETNVLNAQQRAVAAQAFKRGSSLYKQLLRVADQYDKTNGTSIAGILADTKNPKAPYEIRAYAFQFWRNGELNLGDRTVLQKIFDKLAEIVQQIKAYFGAQPQYNTIRELFEAIDRGEFAATSQRMLNEFEFAGELESRAAAETAFGSYGLNQLHTAAFESARSSEGTLPETVRRTFNLGLKGGAEQALRSTKRGIQHWVNSSLHLAANHDGYANFFHNLREILSVTGIVQTSAYKHIEKSWVRPIGFIDALVHATTGKETAAMQELTQAARFIYARNNARESMEAMLARPEFANARGQGWFKRVEDFNAATHAVLDVQFIDHMEHLRRDTPDEQYARAVQETFEHTERLKAEGYIPNRRYGPYAVGMYYKPMVAEGAYPVGDTGLMTRFHFESEVEAMEVIRDLKAQYAQDPDIVFDDLSGRPVELSKDQVTQAANYGAPSFWQFIAMAERAEIPLTSSMKGRLARLALDAESMAQNRVQRRKGIPGSSADVLRSLAEFINSTAARIARNRVMPRVQSALQDQYAMTPQQIEQLAALQQQFAPYSGLAEQSIRDIIMGQEDVPLVARLAQIDQLNRMHELEAHGYQHWHESGEPGSRLRDMSGSYHNRAVELTEFISTPHKQGLGWLRKAAAVQFLGGSLTAAAVNLSSLPMMTMPYLYERAGWDAYPITMRWFKMATMAIGQPSSLLGSLIFRQDPSQLEAALAPGGALPSWLPRPRALALLRAYQEEVISDVQLYELHGIRKHGLVSKSVAVQKAVSAWMTPFRMAEQINRFTSFMAGYEVGEKHNHQTGEELYQYARGTVDNTQFIYSPINRPGVARTPIGFLLMTFRLFPLMAVELITRMNGSQRTLMIGTLLLMGGTDAIPFKDDVGDIVDTIAQRVFGKPLNANRVMANYFKAASEAVLGVDASNVMMHGVIDSFTGASIGARIGMNNLIPGTRIGAAGAKLPEVASEVSGVIGSEVASWLTGLQQILQGDLGKGLTNAVPAAARNWIKALEAIDKGYVTDRNGNKIVDDVTTMEVGLMVAGASLARSTHRFKAKTDFLNEVAFPIEFKKQMYDRTVTAMMEDDDETVQSIAEAVAAWSEHNPEYAIRYNRGQMIRSLRMRNMTPTERLVKKLPKQWQSYAEEQLEEED